MRMPEIVNALQVALGGARSELRRCGSPFVKPL
jgi:hypothetical protein